MSLTKAQIARQLAASQGISVGEATRRLDLLITAMKSRFAVGEKVMITNFGTFEVLERAARRGINPATGERIVIPAHRSVVFHPAPRLLEALRD